MLKMQLNILVAQCLMIAQSVLILIGALKKAGNGAVEGVVDKYYCDLTLYIQQIYRPCTLLILILFTPFIGPR